MFSPYIGPRPVDEITAPEVLALLKRVDTRSAVTARKAYSTCRQIFFNAIAHGLATTNPADGLTVLLSPKRVKHMAAPTEQGEVARLLKALHSLGFSKEDITPHVFRHMASTLLHEMGFPSHLIEKQLAHSDKNRIRAVYNHAEYMPERRAMMQAWADYLEALAAGEENKIVPIRSAKG